MRHPNIIFYLGVSFDENDHYFMVTEYAQKGSIFDLLHNNKGKLILEESIIFKIIKELGFAL